LIKGAALFSKKITGKKFNPKLGSAIVNNSIDKATSKFEQIHMTAGTIFNFPAMNMILKLKENNIIT
jgi:hypothetical protein